MAGETARPRRRLLKILLGAVLALVALIAVALIAIDTDAGRELLRRVAVSTLNDSVLRGRVAIERIDGSLYSDLHVRGITLDDAEGARAIAVDEIHLAYRLAALLGGRVEVRALEIVRPEVSARVAADGTLNLATLVRPGEKEEEPPPADDGPPSLEASLSRFAISSARFAYAAPGQPPLEVRGLELVLSATVSGSAWSAAIARLEAALDPPALAIRGTLRAQGTASSIALETDLHAGDADLEIHDLALALSPPRATGTFRVEVPAPLVRALAGDPDLGVALSLRGELSPGSAERPIAVHVEGSVSDAPLRVDGQVGERGGALRVGLERLDPRRLHAAAPGGALDLAIDADLPRWTTGHAVARLRGGVDLLGDPVRLDELVVTGSLVGREVDVTTKLAVSSPSAPDRASASIDLGARLALGAPLRIITSSLAVDARELRTITRAIPIDGAIHLEAEAHGPADDLSVALSARSASLKAPGAAIAGLEVEAALAHLPGAPEGRAGVRTRSLRTSAIAFDDTRLGARLTSAGTRVAVELAANGRGFVREVGLEAGLARDGGSIAVELARLEVKTASASWLAKDARLARDEGGMVEVRGLDLVSEAGRIRADAKLDPAVWPLSPGQAVITVSSLDLASLAGLAPALRGLAGTVELESRVAGDRGEVDADVDLSVRGVRRQAGGPLDAQVELHLHRQAVTASVAIAGPTIGSLRLTGGGRTPREIRDPAAWRREGVLGAVAGEIPGLELGPLLALTSTSAKITGSIRGKFDVAPRLRDARIALTVERLQVPGLAKPADLELHLEARPDAIDGELAAAVGRERLEIELDSTAGTDAFRRRQLAALEARGTVLAIDARAIPARLIAEVAGLDPHDPRFASPRGDLSFRVETRGAGRDLDVDLSLSAARLAFAQRAPGLDLDTKVKLAARRATAAVRARLAGSGTVAVDLEAAIPRVLDGAAWGAVDAGALRRLHVELEALRLGVLPELELYPGKIEGVVGAEVEIEQGLAGGRASIALDGLRVDPRLATIGARVDAALGSREQVVTATISAPDRAALVLEARLGAGLAALAGGRAGDPALEAHVRTRRLPLSAIVLEPRLRRALDGVLDLAADVRGTLRAPGVSAKLVLAEALLGGTPIEKVEATLASEGGRSRADVRVARGDGGSLGVEAEAEGKRARAVLTAERFGLGFIGGLAKAVSSAAIGLDGALDGKTELRADAEGVKLEGGLVIDRLRVIAPGAPPLEKGKLKLELAGDRANVDLQATLGRGALTAGVRARMPKLGDVDVDAELKLAGTRVDAGETVIAIDSEVKLDARRRGLDTKAEVTIGPTLVTVPPEKGRKLRAIRDFDDVVFVDRLGDRAPVETSTVPEPRPAGTLAATIRTRDPIVIRQGENDLRVVVDLAMRTENARDRLRGEVRVDQGRIAIAGRPYAFRRGVVLFDGRTPPDPRLDIRLAHDFEKLTLLVIVQGTGKRPEVRFASEPGGLDQATLLGYLISGEPSDAGGSGGVGGAAGRAATNAMLSMAVAEARDAMPIDTLDVDPALDDPKKSKSVTAGKWVTDDIFIAYQRRFTPAATENANEGIMRWRFAPGWSLEARFGEREIGSLDAIWLKRF